MWELGGRRRPHALRQAETFFLGPPLPLRGQLYVLAEVNDEIQLLALDADKGKLVWSQQLAVVEHKVYQDPLRRMAGVSPSYADGILVCPTGAGAVAAVDLATRSLLWGYCYSHEQDRQCNPPAADDGHAVRRLSWRRRAAAVAGRHGRDRRRPRAAHARRVRRPVLPEPDRRQAGRGSRCRGRTTCTWPASTRGKIVLVGRHAVRAISLADGKPAWDGRTVRAARTAAAVSGRGFYTGNQYFVPLSTAEVAAVDLDAGKIVQTSKSRKGNVPGNLVCYKGKVISQGWDGVEVFYQVDAAARGNPPPPGRQARRRRGPDLRGEMFLDEGKLAEAVAALRRAYQLAGRRADAGTAARALLDGLRTDFAAYRGRTEEIERLLDDPSQRAALLAADGRRACSKAGQWRAALRPITCG